MSNTLLQNPAVFDIVNEKYQLKTQHQITVGTCVLIIFFQFYMVVRLLTRSKISALGNNYMITFTFLLLWDTIWGYGFGLEFSLWEN